MKRLLLLIALSLPQMSFAENRCDMVLTSSISQVETIVSDLRAIYSNPENRFHEIKVQRYLHSRYSSFDEQINRVVDLVSGQEMEETKELTKNLAAFNEKIYKATLTLKKIVERDSFLFAEKDQTMAGKLKREIALCKGRGGFCETKIHAAYDNLEKIVKEIEPIVLRLDEEVSLLEKVRDEISEDPFFEENLEVENSLSAHIGRFTELSMIVKASFAMQENAMRAAVKELGVFGQELPTLLRGVLLSGKNKGFMKRDFMLKAMDEKTVGYRTDIEGLKEGDIGYVRGGLGHGARGRSGSEAWGDFYEVRRVKILEILPESHLRVRVLKNKVFSRTAVIRAEEIAVEGSRGGWSTGDWVGYVDSGQKEPLFILGFGLDGSAMVAPNMTEGRASRGWRSLAGKTPRQQRSTQENP